MITLPVNKFLGTITNLIAYEQVADSLQAGDVGRFVEAFQDINVDNGDGKVVRFTDIYNVEDLSATSTLLKSNPPKAGEQYIPVTEFKDIPLTINQYLLRGAFVQEDQLAYFIAHLMAVMETTKTVFMAKQLIAEIEAYTPTNKEQTIEVDLLTPTAEATAQEIDAIDRLNAKRIYKALINKVDDVAWDNTKYNDTGYTEIINKQEMNLVIKISENTDMVVDALATLLNSSRITDEEKWGKTLKVPSNKFSTKSNKVIGWLLHRRKVQFGYFYQVATSFFDASTLNQNNWLHFAYYLDTLKPLPMFKIVNKNAQ